MFYLKRSAWWAPIVDVSLLAPLAAGATGDFLSSAVTRKKKEKKKNIQKSSEPTGRPELLQ